MRVPPTALLVMSVVRNKAEPVGPMNALELGGILIGAGVLAYFVSHHDRH